MRLLLVFLFNTSIITLKAEDDRFPDATYIPYFQIHSPSKLWKTLFNRETVPGSHTKSSGINTVRGDFRKKQMI